MDIPSFLATYGGPGGFVAIIAWLFLNERRQSSERRDELRKDIDREQADNDRLRSELAAEKTRNAELEAELRHYRYGGS